jgi:hypothetical protein
MSRNKPIRRALPARTDISGIVLFRDWGSAVIGGSALEFSLDLRDTLSCSNSFGMNFLQYPHQLK